MATSHDRFLCKSFSRYKWACGHAFPVVSAPRLGGLEGKTLNKESATRAGAPRAQLQWETSHRRRIAHDGGVILAQDGSWRFFDLGGDGEAAGRVLPDRTVGDRGRDARQGFLSLRNAAHMNSRCLWWLIRRFASIRHDGRSGFLPPAFLTSRTARSPGGAGGVRGTPRRN